LVHTLVLEALDEMGCKPNFIAGTIMDAPIGTSYTSWLSGRAIKERIRERIVSGNEMEESREDEAGRTEVGSPTWSRRNGQRGQSPEVPVNSSLHLSVKGMRIEIYAGRLSFHCGFSYQWRSSSLSKCLW
jgi:predicted acylesterase/phospholipase RssA